MWMSLTDISVQFLVESFLNIKSPLWVKSPDRIQLSVHPEEYRFSQTNEAELFRFLERATSKDAAFS